MIYEITLKLRVEVEGNVERALDWGMAACEHLNDTFNDNGSLDPLVHVDAEPEKSHGLLLGQPRR